ncbi:unnamed protein product [Pleuronectes platessa]|uniref:Uncharacterized protein n=1 Tax=Pleuronectes platessa TaxID=8262 RepID=A0A9N7UED0_PLEPL|nr:unnamed protein product [Pleuronectes platessa]
MRVSLPKDNPNMTCQAVPLQSQSMVSNQQDHDPPSRPDHDPPSRPERHSSPQSPSTANHHEPPPMPLPDANTTQGPPHWIHHRDPRCTIHKPQSLVRPQMPWICHVS